MSDPDFQSQNLSKSSNELLILTSVYNEPMHGYQIALEIEKKSDSYFKFNHGTLYPILHKLEKDGYIKGIWETEPSKRKRKYYQISKSGKLYTDKLRNSWQQQPLL